MNDISLRGSRFQLSLRALMLIVLVTGGIMGWKANRARTQRRAVAAIRAANQFNDVRYDFQRSGAAEPPAPAWLRRLVGDEYFQEIVHVTLESADPKVMAAVGQLDRLEHLEIHDLGENPGNALAEIGKLKRLQDLSLYGAFGLRDDMLASLGGLPELFRLYIFDADVGDAGLARIAHLPKLETLEISSRSLVSKRLVTDLGVEAVARSMPELRELDLYDSDVTDASLASIGRLSKLTTVRLSGPKVTDAGVAHLSNLRDLEVLQLGQVTVTDEGLKHIQHLKKLRILNFDSDRITDAGLAHIAGLTNLEHLLINSSAITDAGLAHIAGLTKLQSLDLSRGQITGVGLAHLKGLTALYDLDLEKTRITDEGLDDIRKLAGLTILNIRETQVSPKAVAGLQAARPGLAIWSAPMPPRPTIPVPSPTASTVNVTP